MASWQIPLEVGRGVQPLANPLQLQQQALGLRQLAMAGQLSQQQVQQNALKLKAAQEDEEDQKTFEDALANNGGDFDKALTAAQSKGMRIRNVQGLQQAHFNMQRAARQADLDQLSKIKEVNEFVGPQAEAILNAPEEDRAGMWSDAIAQAAARGFNVAGLPTTYPGGADGEKLARSLAAKANWMDQIAKHGLEYQNQQKAAEATQKVQDQANLEAGVARLLQASNGDEYGQILNNLDDRTKARVPKLPAGTDTTQRLSDDFMHRVRLSGLSARDQIMAQTREQRELDTRKSAEEHAANMFGKEVVAALVETGAKDITKPTPDEMRKARKLVTQQKVEEHPKTPAKDTSNPLGIPGWTK